MSGIKKYIFGGMLISIALLSYLIFKPPKREESMNTPTLSIAPTVLGTTDTIIPTATATTVPTVTSIPVTCAGADKALRANAKEFFTYHTAREARTVLNEITPPSTSTDEAQLSFLLGEDQDNTPRLYESAQFAYQVLSYSFGTIKETGEHLEERGTIACTIPVHETRTTQTTNNEFIQETVTRYLTFSVGDGNVILLTDYKDSLTGSKYSGFN